MNLVNLVQICLLHAVLLLVCTDALSIEKTKSDKTDEKSNLVLTTVQPTVAHSKLQSVVRPTVRSIHNQSSVQLNDQPNVRSDARSKDNLNKKSNGLQTVRSPIHSEDARATDNESSGKHIHSKTHLIIKKSQLNNRPTAASEIESNLQPNVRTTTERLNTVSDARNDQLEGRTLSSLLEHKKDKKTRSRTKREPRGRIGGGKGSGPGSTNKRQGAKQDGNDNNEDSGSMNIKPLFSLVILSILFLFVGYKSPWWRIATFIVDKILFNHTLRHTHTPLNT